MTVSAKSHPVALICRDYSIGARLHGLEFSHHSEAHDFNLRMWLPKIFLTIDRDTHTTQRLGGRRCINCRINLYHLL